MKKNRINKKTEAWTHYWTTAPPASSSCIPCAPVPVVELLQGIWADFFYNLPRNATLLDLGTGGGAVLRAAQTRRPDLQLTGVDSAEVLPDLGEEITMLPGVCLEDLPFDNESFDVVTSQFAVEYASLPQAASEIKRVLSKKGVFLLICHHVDSIIVHDNVKRLAAIKSLLAGSGLLNKVIDVVRQKKILQPKKQEYLARLLRTVQLKHPDQPIINEVAALTVSIMTGPDCMRKLLSLHRDIEMEERRISALKVSALQLSQAQNLRHQLSLSEIPIQCKAIYVPGTETPLAWYIHNEHGSPTIP